MLNTAQNSSYNKISNQPNLGKNFKIEPYIEAIPELVPFSVAIILANSLVFVLFIKKITLRTPANYLLLSLAGCDFFTGCVNIPLALMAFTQVVPYPGLSDLFYLVAVLHNFTAVSTGFHILVITLERYLAFSWNVTRPASKDAIFKLLCAVWGASAVIASVPFFWKTQLKEKSPRAANLQLAHAIFCLAAVFILPYTFIIYAYANMLKGIKNARQQRQLAQNSRNQQRSNERRWSVVIFITMGILYLVCWLPWFTLTLIFAVDPFFNSDELNTISHVFIVVRYCNSVLNPVLYTFFKKDFFVAFKQVILRRRREERVCLSALETVRKSSCDDVYMLNSLVDTGSENRGH